MNIQVFLKSTNFYQRFIYSFSDIIHSLFNITGNNSIWVWDNEQQHTFNSLKIAITSAFILTSPKILILFYIKTNSLDFTIEAVLS